MCLCIESSAKLFALTLVFGLGYLNNSTTFLTLLLLERGVSCLLFITQVGSSACHKSKWNNQLQ